MKKAYFVATNSDINVVVMATNKAAAVSAAIDSLRASGIDWIDNLDPVAYDLSEFLADEDNNAIILSTYEVPTTRETVYEVIVDGEWVYEGSYESAQAVADTYWQDTECMHDIRFMTDREFYGN